MKKYIFLLLSLITNLNCRIDRNGVIEDFISLSPVTSFVYQIVIESDDDDDLQQTHIDFDNLRNRKIKQPPKNNTGVRLKDVKGLDEVITEVTEHVEFLQNPTKFIDMGAQLPKGIMLEGPPGTGKTLLARAVAGEAGCAFFHASGPEFHKMYVGEGPAAVRDLFEKARNAAPSIIFIDEFDAVGSKRSVSDDSAAGKGHNALVNELLVQMDGFSKDSSVIVMAATNCVQNLDPALLRPGRFTRKISIPLPGREGRIEILKLYLEKIPNGKIEGDIPSIAKQLADQAYYASPAELKNIVNEAAILAVRDNSDKIRMKHFIEALDRAILGIRNKLNFSKEELRRTAYHEAGHTLLKILTNDPVSRVTIVSRGHALGATFNKSISDSDYASLTREKLVDKIKVALAGGLSEEIIFGNASMGIADDQKQADHLARLAIQHFGTEKLPGIAALARSETMKYEFDKEVLSLLSICFNETRDTLYSKRHLLDKLANALLEKETLSEDEIYKAVGMKKPTA